MHNGIMLRRTCVYLEARDLKALQKIGKKKGGLKVAQMIRLALSEYVQREERDDSGSAEK
jgi:hypothetical protein